jgi:biotin synthase
MMNPAVKQAYTILDGKHPDKKIYAELSRLDGGDILDLISLSGKVKNKFAPDFHACTIMNAKSGACSEDCRFCAQSSHHDTQIDRYGLVDRDAILDKAGEAYGTGIDNFGIVTSGTGYIKMTAEFRQIIDAVDMIHEKYPGKKVCADLGHLSEETAYELSKHDISHYNINIQTNPGKYQDLVSKTHSVNDRIQTILLLKKHGVKVCAGGIIGLGETMEDRLEMAFALRDLDVDIIPLNVLIPIPGTPLEAQEPVSAAEVAKTFALFRLINPSKIIKFAAGRETRMKDFQALIMLAGANGFITGGYLTTMGRNVNDDLNFAAELRQFQ